MPYTIEHVEGLRFTFRRPFTLWLPMEAGFALLWDYLLLRDTAWHSGSLWNVLLAVIVTGTTLLHWLWVFFGGEVVQIDGRVLRHRKQFAKLGWTDIYQVADIANIQWQPEMKGRHGHPSHIEFEERGKKRAALFRITEQEYQELMAALHTQYPELATRWETLSTTSRHFTWLRI